MDPNPGIQLRDYLANVFTLGGRVARSPIALIDEAVRGDGVVLRLHQSSALNFLLRRLIHGAEFIRREVAEAGQHEAIFNERLRTFLCDSMNLGRNAESILVLVKECLTARDRTISDASKRSVRRLAEQSGEFRCYICGRDITFSTTDQVDSATYDHVWPKQLGGLSEPVNLKLACRRCNSEKEDRVDAADFHFEHFSLVSRESDDSFAGAFTNEYRVLALTHNEYACSKCNRTAAKFGPLSFSRNHEDEPWHFLNVSTLCPKHSRTPTNNIR